MFSAHVSGNTQRRSRRKLKKVVCVFYTFFLFVVVAVGVSYRKLFVSVHDQLESKNLLIEDSPVVAKKATDEHLRGIPPNQKALSQQQQQQQQDFSTCAIGLFGLPRAFKDFVLPSLEKNVIAPNAKYGCDYIVHYYQQDSEASGRSGRGGVIQSEDVRLLEASVNKYHNDNNNNTSNCSYIPEVTFVSDTNETFWDKRGPAIQHYRTAKNPDGNYAFFPYGEQTYEYPGTLDNIVKQWHSIHAVWDAMEDASSRKGSDHNHKHHRYRRVAMMRNDVVYITPIDIYSVPEVNEKDASHPNTRDDYIANKASVIPNFAKYPVNDRLIYGPYSSVKVWASYRFSKIEEYAKDPWATPGMIMHSETFLNASILQTIKETAIENNKDVAAIKTTTAASTTANYEVFEDRWMCFLRVRADGAIWIEDCDATKSGFGGGYPGGMTAYTKLLDDFLPNQGKGCRKRRLRDKVRRIIELACK